MEHELTHKTHHYSELRGACPQFRAALACHYFGLGRFTLQELQPDMLSEIASCSTSVSPCL